jgi:hypothetical protein
VSWQLKLKGSKHNAEFSKKKILLILFFAVLGVIALYPWETTLDQSLMRSIRTIAPAPTRL